MKPIHKDTRSETQDLPPFDVTTVPVSQVKPRDLAALIELFNNGEHEPLFLGTNGTPEAAVIPMSDYVRLLRHDIDDMHEAYRVEERAQGIMSRRRAEITDDPDRTYMSSPADVRAWLDQFAPPETHEQ